MQQIGIPAEIAANETRVAATPETVKKLVAGGNRVLVQSGAGKLSAITDTAYAEAGAKIVSSAQDAYNSDIILKVRAPQAEEIGLIKEGASVTGSAAAYHPCAVDGPPLVAGQHRRLQSRAARDSLLPEIHADDDLRRYEEGGGGYDQGAALTG